LESGRARKEGTRKVKQVANSQARHQLAPKMQVSDVIVFNFKFTPPRGGSLPFYAQIRAWSAPHARFIMQSIIHDVDLVADVIDFDASDEKLRAWLPANKAQAMESAEIKHVGKQVRVHLRVPSAVAGFYRRYGAAITDEINSMAADGYQEGEEGVLHNCLVELASITTT
jgi:hypothetical protein